MTVGRKLAAACNHSGQVKVMGIARDTVPCAKRRIFITLLCSVLSRPSVFESRLPLMFHLCRVSALHRTQDPVHKETSTSAKRMALSERVVKMTL